MVIINLSPQGKRNFRSSNGSCKADTPFLISTSSMSLNIQIVSLININKKPVTKILFVEIASLCLAMVKRHRIFTIGWKDQSIYGSWRQFSVSIIDDSLPVLANKLAILQIISSHKIENPYNCINWHFNSVVYFLN